MKVIRNKMSLKDRKEQENAISQAEINRSNIEYIAMMADVELDAESEGAENEQEIVDLASEMRFVIPEKVQVKEKPFSGKTLCVTGKLNHFSRDSINIKISELGAKSAGSVSKNCAYLITNEQSGSSKYKKAVELNIPIITEDEFLKMIGE